MPPPRIALSSALRVRRAAPKPAAAAAVPASEKAATGVVVAEEVEEAAAIYGENWTEFEKKDPARAEETVERVETRTAAVEECPTVEAESALLATKTTFTGAVVEDRRTEVDRPSPGPRRDRREPSNTSIKKMTFPFKRDP